MPRTADKIEGCGYSTIAMIESPFDTLTRPPRRHFLIGNIPELRRDSLGYFRALRRTQGDFAPFWFGSTPVFLLSHPSYVQHVLQDNNKNYSKATRGFQKLSLLLGQGLLTSDGDFWRRQRRIAQPAFHREKITKFGEMMGQAALSTVERWRNFATGKPTDVALEMMRLTMQIVGETLLGGHVVDTAHEVGAALTFALRETMDRVLRLWDMPLAIPTPHNLRYRRAISVIDAVVQRVITEHRQAPERYDDLLVMLLAARDPETGEQMSDAQLRDEVVTMFLAGHETTANALSWTWYLLSQHPDVTNKMLEELHTVLGGRVPTVAELAKLPYTAAVFDESLRLFPPAWSFARRAENEDQVGPHTIPAQSIVFLSPYIVHRHPDFWQRPNDFWPERFFTSEVQNLPRFAFFPFGGGPRQCIGNNFALMEAQIILATLLQHFSFSLAPDFVVQPEPVVVLRPKYGMQMLVTPRIS